MDTNQKKLSRREFLKAAGWVSALSVLAACAPAIATASQATATSTQAAAGGLEPAGSPPSGAPGAGGSSSGGLPSTASAVYKQSGGSAVKAGQTFNATAADQSAVWVSDGGSLTLSNSKITSSGDTSSGDDSSFYGLNAAVLATAGSSILFSDSSVVSSGAGANGVFSTGSGSSITVSKVTIQAAGDGGHGVMATQGGKLTLTDVDIDTKGPHSAPIATDRGGGAINVTGGKVTTSGQDSPCLYSTGELVVSGGVMSASGAESAVIEGANSISLTNSDLSSSKDGKWGVMIYQSMSGDAQGAQGVFSMNGGSLANTAANGPLFYVTNSTGVITLKGVKVIAASGVLVKAATGNWGNSGANGGAAVLTADGQSLIGDLTADKISMISVILQNGSALAGAINGDGAAKAANLTMDSSSSWEVTADSHLAALSLGGGISGDSVAAIKGNGHSVTYDSNASPALGGKTYSLNGGGTLMPA